MYKALLIALISLVGAGSSIDLTLDEAVRLALEKNKDILLEEQNVEISSAGILSEWAKFDPAFRVSSSFRDAQEPTASTFIERGSIQSETLNMSSSLGGELPTGTSYKLFDFDVTRTETDSPIEVLSPGWETSLSFSIGQELLKDFGVDVNMAQINVARRSKDMSIKELEAVVSDVVVNVVSEYWTLVAAYQALELANTALELALDLQRRNEIQVEVGVLAPVEVTQAKSEVAARRVDLIAAENDLEASEDRLKNLLSVPLGARVVPVDEPATVRLELDREEVLEMAIESRPELAQARLDRENQRTLKKFFGNQRLPTLSVEGSLILSGLGGEENPARVVFGPDDPQPIAEQFSSANRAFEQLVDRDFLSWEVMGVVSIPLYNASARGDYRRAVAELRKSDIEYARLVDTVSLDVNNSIREVENSLSRIDAARVSVELAEEVLRNEEDKLEVGMATTRDVLEAQRDLVDARLEQIRAVADYNRALIRLDRARGTILYSRGINIRDDVLDGG